MAPLKDLARKPADAGRKAADLLKGGGVLLRSGLVSVTNPVENLRYLRAVERFGPFVATTQHVARMDPRAVALVDELGTITYKALDEQSNALARALRADGVAAGENIAVLARDHRGLVLTMLAAGKLGARLVMMNTGFAGPQLADVSAREKVRAVLHDGEFTELLSHIPDSIPRYLTWVDDDGKADLRTPQISALVTANSQAPLPAPAKPGGFVLLTSGTTGTPKGAPREKTSPLASAQFLDRIPMRSGQTVFMAAPIFHGTGLSQFVLSFALGNTVVTQRRFHPEKTLKGVAKHRANVLVVVPTMLQRIIDLDPQVLAKYDTSSLRIIFAAGSSLSPDLCRRVEQLFGPVLYNLYGSTEVAVASVATPEELHQAPGTVGRPPVTCRVVLFDNDGKRITTPHTIGRIFVASGLSFAGYTDGRNKEIIDGLLSSGDVGHFDEAGLLFVDGRDDDMIISGGENVYPLEVENLLAGRPDVHEAAVVGVPDEDFGQRLKAYIVKAPGSALDEDEVKNYVKEHLARYKVPREVVFLDELPRNATGKLLRRNLT